MTTQEIERIKRVIERRLEVVSTRKLNAGTADALVCRGEEDGLSFALGVIEEAETEARMRLARKVQS